jgi:hypothetical protein
LHVKTITSLVGHIKLVLLQMINGRAWMNKVKN